MSDKIYVRLAVHGMTCTGCEDHVREALHSVGAENIVANFRRGEATFDIYDETSIETAKHAIAETGYKPGDVEVLKRGKGEFTSNTGQCDYDLLIIGSGGAAFSAAIQAISYGAKVGMIERGTIGGTCVNIGCVPSKTLLRAGEINHNAQQNPFAGLQTNAGPVDLKTLVAEKNKLVAGLRQHKYEDLIDDYGFELLQGEARFVDKNTVEVNGDRITAQNFLIATGASPAVPNIPGLEDVDYLVSTTALELQEVPQRLAVIGSGYIAMELGQLFHNLGAEVKLMQRSDQVLKHYDPEISEVVTQALTEQGLQLIPGATFNWVEQDGRVKRVHITVDGQERLVEAEQLLVATGRRPNVDALNLKAANVKIGAR